MAFHSKWKQSAQVTSQAFRASLTETRRRFRAVHRFIVSFNCHITPWYDIADKEEGSLTPPLFPPFYCFVCVFEVCWVRGALAIHFSYQTESATVLTLSGHFIRSIVLLLNDQKAYQPHTAANRYIRACRRGEDSLEKFKASIRVGKETEVTLEAVNMVQATTDC